MVQQALGLIETRGLVAAIEAADVALKTAAVELINYEKVKGGLICVAVTGEVAAVQAAVAAGSVAAAKVGDLISHHVIARPMADLRFLINNSDPDPEPDNSGQVFCGEESDVDKEYLQSLTVVELRRLARKTTGIAIEGRQISKANKEQLITEIINCYPVCGKGGS